MHGLAFFNLSMMMVRGYICSLGIFHCDGFMYGNPNLLVVE